MNKGWGGFKANYPAIFIYSVFFSAAATAGCVRMNTGWYKIPLAFLIVHTMGFLANYFKYGKGWHV